MQAGSSVLAPIDSAFQQSLAAIDEILSIPQGIFKSASTSSQGPIEAAFQRARKGWDATTSDVTAFRTRAYRAFGRALRLAEESRATDAADDSILWLDRFRDNLQKDLDKRVLTAESKLNELVNKPTDAINQVLNAAIQSAADTVDDIEIFDKAAALEKVKQSANGGVSMDIAHASNDSPGLMQG